MSDFGLKRDDFKGRPGYRETPAKVWRRGVGYVDGFKWSYRAPKAKRSRKQISTADLGDMMKPAVERHRVKAATDMQKRGDVQLESANGFEYVPPERANDVALKNGWHSPGRIVGLLATGINGEWCSNCDRRRSWCECQEA